MKATEEPDLGRRLVLAEVVEERRRVDSAAAPDRRNPPSGPDDASRAVAVSERLARFRAYGSDRPCLEPSARRNGEIRSAARFVDNRPPGAGELRLSAPRLATVPHGHASFEIKANVPEIRSG